MSVIADRPAEVEPESYLLNSRLAARLGTVAFGVALTVFCAVLVASAPVGLMIGLAVTGLWALTVAVL